MHKKTEENSQSDFLEQWRKISDWPYEVSTLGRVRRIGSSRQYKNGRLLVGTMGASGSTIMFLATKA